MPDFNVFRSGSPQDIRDSHAAFQVDPDLREFSYDSFTDSSGKKQIQAGFCASRCTSLIARSMKPPSQ
jgi:hypothetical protein